MTALPGVQAAGDLEGRASALQGLSQAALALIGLTCAICVANNYYAQPLLVEIARDFGLPPSLSGLAPTLTQVGIALGMFFVLPLGDRIDNRRITTFLLVVQAFALATMAAARDPRLYFAACLAVGLCGIVTYLLPAYATRLVPPTRRGAVTGLLATGTLTGIMLGRSLAGIVGFEAGWRAVYAGAALATFAMAATMKHTMPPTPGLNKASYPQLIRSLGALIGQSALLRRATLLQALSFGSFNALWVGLTLHLQQAPFHLDTRAIGELALVAVTAALVAPLLGRMVDRHSTDAAVRLGFAANLGGWAALVVLPDAYAGIVAGMVLVGIGALATDIALRAALYGLAPEIRMRLNAAYSTGTFAGGAVFAFAVPLLWSAWGWLAVGVVAIATNLAGFALARLGGHDSAAAPASRAA